MGFEVFNKASASKGKVAPTVTIQRRGMFSISREAYALVGEPPAVELLWDPDRRIIGIRATDQSNANAHLVHAQSPKRDNGPLIVTATKFARHYGIPTDEPCRRVVQLEDDILCIDLKEEGEAVGRGHRGAQNPAAADPKPSPPLPVAG